MRDQSEFIGHSNRGDLQIVWANWRSLSFQISSYLTLNSSGDDVEIQVRITGKKVFDDLQTADLTLAFIRAIEKLRSYDRTDNLI